MQSTPPEKIPTPETNTILENSSFFSLMKHILTPQNAANIFLSALITTIATGCIKIPGEKINLAMSSASPTNFNHTFRAAFAFASWRYFPSYIRHTFPKSSYVVASKHDPRSKEELPSKEYNEESILLSFKHYLNRFSYISNIALIETKLSNYGDQKLALQQRPNPPIFLPTAMNNFNVYKGNFGISYLISLFNLGALTHLSDALQEKIFGTPKAKSTQEAMIVGALSGTISVFLTYPFKEIKNDTNLGAHVVNGKLKYPSLQSIIKAQIKHIQESPIQLLCRSFIQKITTRTVQSSLLFSTIITVNHILGLTPADDLKTYIDKKFN
jgi:hypothetical protein